MLIALTKPERQRIPFESHSKKIQFENRFRRKFRVHNEYKVFGYENRGSFHLENPHRISGKTQIHLIALKLSK